MTGTNSSRRWKAIANVTPRARRRRSTRWKSKSPGSPSSASRLTLARRSRSLRCIRGGEIRRASTRDQSVPDQAYSRRIVGRSKRAVSVAVRWSRDARQTTLRTRGPVSTSHCSTADDTGTRESRHRSRSIARRTISSSVTGAACATMVSTTVTGGDWASPAHVLDDTLAPAPKSSVARHPAAIRDVRVRIRSVGGRPATIREREEGERDARASRPDFSRYHARVTDRPIPSLRSR